MKFPKNVHALYLTQCSFQICVYFCFFTHPHSRFVGDGKTHYIESQMKQSSECLRVAVNEAFTALSTIQKLAAMEFSGPEPAVFFNFTLLPPGVSAVPEEVRHVCPNHYKC